MRRLNMAEARAEAERRWGRNPAGIVGYIKMEPNSFGFASKGSELPLSGWGIKYKDDCWIHVGYNVGICHIYERDLPWWGWWLNPWVSEYEIKGRGYSLEEAFMDADKREADETAHEVQMSAYAERIREALTEPEEDDDEDDE